MITARFVGVLALSLVSLSVGALRGQQQKPPAAYPERDALTPFRNPQEIVAPPDELFRLLSTMRRIGDEPGAAKSFDAEGREVVDDEVWRESRRQAERIGIDAAILANVMRNSRNADERAVAFYAGFFSPNEEHVFNLIGHIPGEPERKTRERAYPRAIAYLRAHIDRKFGDLPPDEQQRITASMPTPGSPAANAAGIKRLPLPEDTLFTVNLRPFMQLLDLDDELDQAQSLWFLKECFRRRRDLAMMWLEPSLPRLRQLSIAPDERVREQAIGVLAAIGPKDLAAPAVSASPEQLDAFADKSIRAMFPPIRRLSPGLLVLLPGDERAAIVAAGRAALTGDSVGAPARGKTADGQWYRGFRVDHVPAELEVLGIPNGAVITAVNGTPVQDGKSLLQAIGDQFFVREKGSDGKPVLRAKSSGTLFVDLLVGDQPKALEYRVL